MTRLMICIFTIWACLFFPGLIPGDENPCGRQKIVLRYKDLSSTKKSTKCGLEEGVAVKRFKMVNQKETEIGKNKSQYRSPSAKGKIKSYNNRTKSYPQALTANDVYRMIMENGFYCDITPGSPFHQEAIKTLQNPPKTAFPLKRKITTLKEQNGFILTKSIHTRPAQNNENKKIQLHWTPKITYCTYEQAIEIIKILNKTYTGKKQTWRIPTVMELFSIVRDKTENHLPPAFKPPGKQTLVFWTSTPVKKQGTVLEYDKKNTACFVVRSLYDKNKNTYSLGFGFQNIGPNHNTKAFLIPVRSSKVYTYKPTISQPQQPKKSPGTPKNKPPAKTPQTKPLPKFHDPDKVPGFDDYKGSAKKQTKKTASAGKKSGQPHPGNKVPGFDQPTGGTNTKPAVSYTFKIALYPIFREGIVDDDKEKFLENLKKQVKQEVFVLGAKVKRELTYGLSLEEKKLNIFDVKSRKEIGQLNKFIVDPYLSQAAKLRKIKDEIMSAPHLDIVIVIQYFDTDDDDIYFLVPTIISSISHEIYSSPFVLKESQAGILSKYVKEITGKIIYNFFSIRSR